MSRPIKYQTADDILDACQIHNDCYVWTDSAALIPVLGPSTAMAQKFKTVSVVRILFIICRYIPLGKRLVRKCNTHYCVNPFHYSEAQSYRALRAKLPNPNGLFPQQEDIRDQLAPSDAELDLMRPKKPVHIKQLLDSASIAGYAGEGIKDKYVPPSMREPKMPDPDVPVLVMKMPAKPAEPAPALQDWDEFEAELFGKPKSLPEVRDETEDVAHDEPENDIFAMIERRKEWERTKIIPK